ncbi:hypothetical protein FHG87_010938, partial [Trinorchestia longiramus]
GAATQKLVYDTQLRHQHVTQRLMSAEQECAQRKKKLSALQETLCIVAERSHRTQLQLQSNEATLQHLKKEMQDVQRCQDAEARHISASLHRLHELALHDAHKVGVQKATCRAVQSASAELQQLRQRIMEALGRPWQFLWEVMEHIMARLIPPQDSEAGEAERRASEAQRRVREARGRLTKLTASHASLMSHLTSLTMHLHKLGNEQQQQQQQLDAACAVQQRCSTQLQQLVASRQVNIGHCSCCSEADEGPVDLQLRAVQVAVQEACKQRRQLEKHALTLQGRLLQQEESLQHLQNEIQTKQKELRVTKERFFRASAAVDSAESSLQKTLQKREALQRCIGLADSELQTLQQQRDSAAHEATLQQHQNMAELKDLEDDYDRRLQNIQQLRDKLERTQCDVWQKREQVEEWKKRVEELEAVKRKVDQVAGAGGDHASTKAEINRLQGRWRALEVQQQRVTAALQRTVDSESSFRTKGEAVLAKTRAAPQDVAASRGVRQEAARRRRAKLDKVRQEAIRRKKVRLDKVRQKGKHEERQKGKPEAVRRRRARLDKRRQEGNNGTDTHRYKEREREKEKEKERERERERERKRKRKREKEKERERERERWRYIVY